MVKGDSQLHHTLDMQTEKLERGLIARDGAPDILENFMSVEEVAVVEQFDASMEIRAAERHGHKRS